MPRPPIDVLKIHGLRVLTKDEKYDRPSRLFRMDFRCELTCQRTNSSLRLTNNPDLLVCLRKEAKVSARTVAVALSSRILHTDLAWASPRVVGEVSLSWQIATAFIITFSHFPAISAGDMAIIKTLPLCLAAATRAKLSDLPRTKPIQPRPFFNTRLHKLTSYSNQETLSETPRTIRLTKYMFLCWLNGWL
jgi:hypothetical protein